jgi:hypothetical protein
LIPRGLSFCLYDEEAVARRRRRGDKMRVALGRLVAEDVWRSEYKFSRYLDDSVIALARRRTIPGRFRWRRVQSLARRP